MDAGTILFGCKIIRNIVNAGLHSYIKEEPNEFKKSLIEKVGGTIAEQTFCETNLKWILKVCKKVFAVKTEEEQQILASLADCISEIGERPFSLIFSSLNAGTANAKEKFVEACWEKSEVYRQKNGIENIDKIRPLFWELCETLYDETVATKDFQLELDYSTLSRVEKNGDLLEKILKCLEADLSNITRDTEKNVFEKPSLIDNFIINNDPVIGREDKLQAISDALKKNRVVFIRGMGGIGKSVLAKKYADIHKEEYNVRIEVSSDSFRGVVNAIGIRNWDDSGLDEETKYSVKLQLLKDLMQKQKSILIVHDYNTSDDPDARWRELPCDMLITTWNDWGDTGEQIRLRENSIKENSAVEIFAHYYLYGNEYQEELRGYLEKENDSVKELVRYVGYHPLSIKVLAKQMVCEADDIITPKQMLEELSFSDEKEFANIHESGEGSKSENATAHEHLEKIYLVALQKKRLNKEAMEALRYMTLTSSVCGISSTRFSKWTDLDKKLLYQIEKRGWIELDRERKDYLDEDSDKKGIYRMPMVVSEILYQAESLRSTLENSEEFVNRCKKVNIDKCVGYEQRNSLEEQLVVLLAHIMPSESEEYANLLDTAGCVLVKNSKLKKALEYQEKALEIRKRVLGENHVVTAESYNNVGCIYGQMGERQRGKEYKEKALSIRRNILGENHVDTASSYNNVGYSYIELGEKRNGIKYQERALEIYQKIYGDNNADTALCYSNVGYTYYEIGEFQKGLEYQEKALKIRKLILGENHTDTADSYNNIGYIYKSMGLLKKGLEYQEKALEIRLRVLGENHINTAQSYSNVGCAYDELGECQRGLEYQEKALYIRLKVFGENHVDTALSYENIGIIYINMGDIENGMKYQKMALGILVDLLGVQDPYIATVYSNIGYSYEQMGEREKGLEYKEKALEIRLQVLGENHADTAQSYNNVGYTYEQMGERAKGLEYKEKALEIRKRVLGENHASTAASYNNVGCAFEEMGERAKGLEYKEKALEIYRRVLGENHASTATSYNNVGISYEKMGERAKGLEYKEKALEIRKRVLGENHADTATSYNNVGISYEKMGERAKGLEYKEKALEIRKRVLGEKHADTAASYNNVGISYDGMGERAKGLEYKEKALEIRKRVLGENHASTAVSYHNVGYSYLYYQDRYDEAYDYLNKAYKVFVGIYGEKHKQTQRTKKYRDEALSHLNAQ